MNSWVNSRGLQAQCLKGTKIHDSKIKTVQNELQKILRRMNRKNDVPIFLSSRTDAGVHALSTTIGFQLPYWKIGNRELTPQLITNHLNSSLHKKGEHIRVMKTLRVSDDFNCRRQALYRKYIYRIAVPKISKTDQSSQASEHDDDQCFDRIALQLSALEHDKCSVVHKPFSFDKFVAAAKLISGTHDFGTFTTERGRAKAVDHVKKVSLGIRRGTSLLEEYQPSEVKNKFDFFEIHVEGKSFMYKQVRRIVGAIVQVACNQSSLDDIQQWMKNGNTADDKKKLSTKIKTLPACGLFLKEVIYNPADLVFRESTLSLKLYKLWTLLNIYQKDYEHYRQQMNFVTQNSGTKYKKNG